MIVEENKYRAEVFKIAGFALLTPAGRLALSFTEHGFSGLADHFPLNIVIAMGLCILGIIFIQRGFEFLRNKGN